MRKTLLLVPAFAGTFVLGRSVGQEVQTFCEDCESTYISADVSRDRRGGRLATDALLHYFVQLRLLRRACMVVQVTRNRST